MGKLNIFSINFDNNRQVFYPGEQISGHVIVDLKDPMEMRRITIEFEGKSYCHWSEQRGSGDNRRTVHYRGSEKLFEYVSSLYGQMPNVSGPKSVLGRGQVTLPFVFTVPPNMPSSFEGGRGYIRYEFKAVIDRPWKFDHKVKRPVVINAVIDPNDPKYLYSPGGTEHKDVGCLCCAAGPLDISANLDRCCYCPGENVLITAKVENNTTRDMPAMKGKLVRVIEYHASSKTKREENVVARIDGAAILKGQFANWVNQPLTIPAVNPSIFNSRVIVVRYYIKIEIDVPWGVDPSVNIPVVLGTVPFRYGQPPPQLMAPANPNMMGGPPMGGPPMGGPPMGGPPMVGPPMFGNAPPSYASIMGEQPVNISGDDDQHTRGELSYLPMYTFAQPPPQNMVPTVYPSADPTQMNQMYSPAFSGGPPPGADPSGQFYPPPGQPYPPSGQQYLQPGVSHPEGQVITVQPGKYHPPQMMATAPPSDGGVMQEKPPQ